VRGCTTSLRPKYGGGRPPKFTLPQRQKIKKTALGRPADHGLPFSTWSLPKLADFLVAEGVVDDISHEGLRLLLREEGVSFGSREDLRRPAPTRTSRPKRTGCWSCMRSPTARLSPARMTRPW